MPTIKELLDQQKSIRSNIEKGVQDEPKPKPRKRQRKQKTEVCEG